jgi:hypothetical protein
MLVMMDDHIPTFLENARPSYSHLENNLDETTTSGMSPADTDNLDNAAIARRLRALRHHVSGSGHGSRADFAARTKIEYKRWNNYERGFPIRRDAAIHLVKTIHGLTLDWIYLGRQDGMPARLQRELEDAGKAVILSEERGSSGSSRKPITRSRA